MEQVDKGVSNTVTVLAVHRPSGLLYMGGLFRDATGVPVRYVDVVERDQLRPCAYVCVDVGPGMNMGVCISAGT